MTRCKKILIGLTAACLSSCQTASLDETEDLVPGIDYPTTENVEGGQVTYQYKEDVVVLSERNQSYLKKVEADTILYFSKSAKNQIELKEGGIISSALTNELTPYGLGNKILSITEEGDYIRCVTTGVSLSDIFEELEIKAEIELFCDTISQTMEDVNGNIVTISVDKGQDLPRASFGSPNVLTINLGNKTDKTRFGPYLTGSMSLGAVATLDIDLQNNQSECSLALYAGFDGEIGIQGTWQSKFLKLLPRTGTWNIVTGVVAIGPVVLRPFIDVELGLQGKIEGTASTKLSKQFGGKFGFKNGKAFTENLTNPGSADIIKNISLNAAGELNFVTNLNFGMGLYTKNLAVGIDPSISAGFSTDFRLNNENLFRDQPNLDFKISANADAFFYAQLFGKELSHEQATLAEIDLFTYSWPLLPSLVENSLKIKKRDYNGPLMFDAEYQVQGGLLTDLSNKLGNYFDGFTIMPTFRVYRGGNEVYHVIDAQDIKGSGLQTFKYELGDLEHDISYTGKPCMIIGDNMYDEDGISFSSTSPTVAITDIVQTGASSGSFPHGGYTYDYEFYFYVNMYIKGSENCTEWGIYAPNSDNIYNPYPLKDGRITHYWTGWANRTSVTHSLTPYVILKEDGSTKFFEQNWFTLYYNEYYDRYGHSRSDVRQAPSASPSLKTIKQGDLIMRLDSIKYEEF